MSVSSRLPSGRQYVLPLRAGALAEGRVGSAAARLSAAAGHGLAVLPGFAVTTAGVAGLAGSPAEAREVLESIRARWPAVRARGFAATIICQSWVPDGDEADGARLRTATCGCVSWPEPVETILELAEDAGRALTGDAEHHAADSQAGGAVDGRDEARQARPAAQSCRLGLVVQGCPQVRASGVAFATDPFGGRGRGRWRRPLIVTRDGSRASRRVRRRVRRLVGEAGRLFGRPQDVDWLLDTSGGLWLLSSRDLCVCRPGA